MTHYVPVEQLTAEHLGREAAVTYVTDGIPQPPFFGTVTENGDTYAITASAEHMRRMAVVSEGQNTLITARTRVTVYVQED